MVVAGTTSSSAMMMSAPSRFWICATRSWAQHPVAFRSCAVHGARTPASQPDEERPRRRRSQQAQGPGGGWLSTASGARVSCARPSSHLDGLLGSEQHARAVHGRLERHALRSAHTRPQHGQCICYTTADRRHPAQLRPHQASSTALTPCRQAALRVFLSLARLRAYAGAGASPRSHGQTRPQAQPRRVADPLHDWGQSNHVCIACVCVCACAWSNLLRDLRQVQQRHHLEAPAVGEHAAVRGGEGRRDGSAQRVSRQHARR
jgi:hypothetical protein